MPSSNSSPESEHQSEQKSEYKASMSLSSNAKLDNPSNPSQAPVTTADTSKSHFTSYGQLTHPNFVADTPLENLAPDPARPLATQTDEADAQPAKRYEVELADILEAYGIDDDATIHGEADSTAEANDTAKPNLPDWGLIASPSLFSHLELLQAGRLAQLPPSFYASKHPSLSPHSIELPTPLTELNLLDLADIRAVMRQLPNLTRYGIQTSLRSREDALQKDVTQKELLNDIYADDWHVILHPEQFDNGEDSLATDLMACRVAVHLLAQCDTRKTINRSLSAEQICHHARSYLLSQCVRYPQFADQYRQIRLFAGHIIFAMRHLGLEMTITNDGEVFANVSSRSTLFTHYPNVPSYYVTGWQ